MQWHGRDAKHPREKKETTAGSSAPRKPGNIIQRQPRTSEYIFPYNSRSIQAAFTRACQILGIEDLHFHDCRHEATSRLFERGYQIHEVAQFTLHDSWNELKRYTNLGPRMFAPSAPLTSDLLGKCRKALHPSRLSRPLALRVNQFSKIHRTHQPW